MKLRAFVFLTSQFNTKNMKKILITIAVVVVAGLIVIQFFPPEKNSSAVTQASIFYQLEVPELIKKKLVNSCFDCHSNQTRYPWYNKVAPISWILSNHIREGKEHLNFSRWADYSKREQIKMLGEICEVLEEGSMPLKSYLLIHTEAKIFDHDVENICEWTDEASMKILSGK